MLTIQVEDDELIRRINKLLTERFDGNMDAMLREMIRLYAAQMNREKYSGILKWEKDGLAYQKEIRL